MAEFEEAPEVDRLDWDAWNLEHITKHGITREQVEEAFASGETIARATRKNRFLVLGPTQVGRLLAVVIGPLPPSPPPPEGESPDEPGAFYTFSARPASRQERRYYRQQKGGEQ
jgi:uncharacterized DUF497 family protein